MALTVAAVSGASLLTNGDFETGDFTGWSTFTTENGRIGAPAVVLFDVNGDGTPTYAARLNVGELSLEPGCELPTGGFDGACRNGMPELFEGGGISQTVVVNGDTPAIISADVAAWNDFSLGNATAGWYELLVNGVVVDSLLSTDIAPHGIFRGALSASTMLMSGSNTVAVRVTRPWLAPGHLGQYVDNVAAHSVAKGAILADRGVPGRGIDDAPGLDKPFNPKSRAAEHVGPDANSGAPSAVPSSSDAGIIE